MGVSSEKRLRPVKATAVIKHYKYLYLQIVDTMIARLQRWGNSLAVRIPKDEIERLGLGEGSSIDIALRPLPASRIDISDRPTYRDPDPDLSMKVDEILYGEE